MTSDGLYDIGYFCSMGLASTMTLLESLDVNIALTFDNFTQHTRLRVALGQLKGALP